MGCPFRCNIHDQVHNTCEDMGLTPADLTQLTVDYLGNMAALRAAVLKAGKFAWQVLYYADAVLGRCRIRQVPY